MYRPSIAHVMMLVVLAAFVAYVVLGDPGRGGGLWPLLLGSGVLALVAGIRTHRPRRARNWWLLAGGLALFALGYLPHLLTPVGPDAPIVVVGDLLLLAGYPLMITAAAGFSRAQSVEPDRGPLLDAAIMSIAVVAVVMDVAMYRQQLTWSTDAEVLVTLLTLAIGSSLLWAMTVRLFLAGGHRAISGWALLASSSSALIGTARLAWGGQHLHLLVESRLWWGGSVLLFALSAAHRSMVALSEPADVGVAHVRTRGLLLAVALLAPPVSLLTRYGASAETALLPSLASVVIAALVMVRFTGLLRGEERARRLLRFQVLHDPLTELPNRRLFVDRFEQALGRRGLEGHHLAVLFLDLDGFKRINDLHGHAVGDALLVEVAARLRTSCRPDDTVARFAGDEFVVLLQEVTPDVAIATAERLVTAVAAPATIGASTVEVGVSIGIAWAPTERLGADEQEHQRVLDALLSAADHAMYDAKQSTSTAVRVAHPPTTVGGGPPAVPSGRPG